MSVFGVRTGKMVQLGQWNKSVGAVLETPADVSQRRCPMTAPKSTRAREIPQPTAAQIARFWSRVNRSAGPDKCWPWDRPASDGYGQTSFYHVHYKAHRVAYTLVNGPIPADCEIDHVRARGCTSKACCNPAHLEAVSHRVNTLRSDCPAAIQARKTHCLRGHAFDAVNTYITRDGARSCRTCHRLLAVAAYRKKQAARKFKRQEQSA